MSLHVKHLIRPTHIALHNSDTSQQKTNTPTMNPSFTTDITTDIFARLPAKSAAKCRTLSKQWSSILTSPDFASLFLGHSSTRPRLLLAVERDGLWTFFTTPQSSPSPVVTAEFHTTFNGDVSRYLCSYASGLILFPDFWVPKESSYSNPVVCNPFTGKYVTLPYLEIYRKSRAFLGFDHVGKKFKALSEEYPFCSQRNHHQVLSLGEGGEEEELSWRVVKDGPQYDHCLSEAIQIDGVLYYLAENISDLPRVVVCFDVRSETFEFIEAGCFAGEEAVKLINYKGRVAGVNWKYVRDDDEKIVLELSLWVLGDVEMKEWVKSVYVLSEEKIVRRCNFSVGGMTGDGEIVLAMDYTAKPYYVFFFDPEKNTLRSVEVRGFGDRLEAIGTRGRVRVFVDYVEDLNVHDGKELKSIMSQPKSSISASP